jgi:hypothetical protein
MSLKSSHFGLCILLFLTSCNILHSQKSADTPPLAAPSPMSCKIHGQIIVILPKLDAGAENLCTKYPCTAMVLVKDVIACGSSVSERPNSGDTLTIQFAYSLANTSKSMPSMAAHYPGLKKGDNFLANVDQRLLPGQKAQYLVFDYKRIK